MARKCARGGLICASSRGPCCPVIRVQCRDEGNALDPVKMCRVYGGRKSRKMNSASAGKYVAKLKGAQEKRRCVVTVLRKQLKPHTYVDINPGLKSKARVHRRRR